MKLKSRKKHISGITAVSIAALTCASAISVYSLASSLSTENQPTADDLKGTGDYILGRADTAPENADMDGDGVIDAFDMVLMRQALSAGTGEDTEDDTAEKHIYLEGTSIRYEGSGMSLNETADIITISKPGTFIVTGELENGQIIVDVDKDAYPEGAVELSLEGMEISCSDNSPIYIASIDDECTITAKKGTDNIISDGTSYTNADEDCGAIYSKDDLKFKGKGNLTVNGNCADGIVGKDDVKIHNGNITVNAVDDGIRGKDSVRIGDADDLGVEDAFKNLSVAITTTSGDGITSTNADDEGKGYITINGGTVYIDSYADGVQAEQDVTVNGGDITIETYEGSSFSGNASSGSWGGSSSAEPEVSAKGLKSNGTLTINGGTINIDSSDDCIHSAGNLSLIGGKLSLATADDACHSDADLTIGNGAENTFDDIVIYATKCYEGIEGLNITQNSGTVIINSTDDGYNAAGGADGSGNTSPGGWNSGGFGGSTGSYSLNLKGGFALVNISDGDHDGFDSNGTLTISGGYFITNGNEPFDCDGSKTYSGGVYVINKGSGGMGGGPGGMGGSELASTVTASCSANSGTRITLADGENVIVSFIAGKNVTSLTAGCNAHTGAKFYTGGTITGTPVAELNSQICYIDGTISGGTALT